MPSEKGTLFMGCVICNSTKKSFVLVANGYALERCVGCGLVSTSAESAGKTGYYEEEYYTNSEKISERVYNRIISEIEIRKFKKLKSKGNILDIGCGDGVFLSNLSGNAEWNLYGVEISKAGFEKAKARRRLKVFNNPLSECGFSRGFFDVIVMRHVLEHISSPQSMLAEIKMILKPGGVLVLRVPNFASIEASLGGRDWLHMDLPRHLFHYTPETITMLLEKNGFEVKKINHLLFEYRQVIFYSISGWLAEKTGLKFLFSRRSALNKFFFAGLLPLTIFASYLLALMKKSGTIEIYARKQA